ncbi:MAG: FAD-dependent oxidoreductase [Anaerolineales bacterium]|nr:FAD-dependent oxidoreductase [Anaerolineales bacterium]
MEREIGNIQDCLQNEPAFCTAACPFRLDVRDFIEKIQRGAFNGAYRMYLNAVGFPAIVSALCDQPCQGVCPRRVSDEAISLRRLEAAALSYARNTEPNNYNLPPKNKKVAVIGAGLSGLACALRLASRKYEVTVFERSNRIGGHLWQVLAPEVFLNEFERQFMHETINLRLETEIVRLDDLAFDAVYVATGAGGPDFGLESDPNGAFASTTPGIFLGGSLRGGNSMQALADGLDAIPAIERYLKVGSMNQPWEQVSGTKLTLDPALVARSEPIHPADGLAYTRDEALLEAKRCLRCSCDACVRFCDLMHYFNKYPKRIAEEVELTIHPGTLDGNGTIATRFISTCNQCGLCKEVCPVDIDMGEFLLQNHRTMRAQGAMPWVFHDFWLRDMEFSNSPAAQVARRPAGISAFDPARKPYAFFPGCQLGASDPQYVLKSYGWLLEQQPETALLLQCCGAPAEWAGDQAIHAAVLAQLREHWQDLGQPTLIFACPTCKQKFGRYLPEMAGVFLYDLMFAAGLAPTQPEPGATVSVFDPCASRDEPALQQNVRRMVDQAGFNRQPLPLEGKQAACCSWGGQVSTTNPRYAREVVSARITQNDLPYVTYCANCRDIFAASHKPAYHLLDLMFGLHGPNRVPPTLTERRNNRIRLKQQVLIEFWKDESPMPSDPNPINLSIPPEVRQKLSDDMLLESEIARVVAHCERTGKKIQHPESGYFSGHLQIGNLTYWAEYYPTENGFVLVRAYSHRMSIDQAAESPRNGGERDG